LINRTDSSRLKQQQQQQRGNHYNKHAASLMAPAFTGCRTSPAETLLIAARQ